MEATNVAFYLVKSFLFSDVVDYYCPKIARLLLSNSASTVLSAENVEADVVLASEGEMLTYDDVKAVQERIGMVGWRNDEDRREEGRWSEALDELLEEKAASMEELKEAFYVFDRNEDGFISPAELWSVMRRLGMKEGMRMEDCERMICAFDEDGDGRISFSEFKKLLENAL